jgi:hypothetical protein
MSERCAALDPQGKRCRNKGFRREQYHGSDYYNVPGTFENMPGWVLVWLCSKHCTPASCR